MSVVQEGVTDERFKGWNQRNSRGHVMKNLTSHTNEFRYWMQWEWETQTNFLDFFCSLGNTLGATLHFQILSLVLAHSLLHVKTSHSKTNPSHCPPLLPPILLQHLSHWLFCLPALLAFMGSCDDTGPTLIPPWWSPYFKVSWLASAPAEPTFMFDWITRGQEILGDIFRIPPTWAGAGMMKAELSVLWMVGQCGESDALENPAFQEH